MVLCHKKPNTSIVSSRDKRNENFLKIPIYTGVSIIEGDRKDEEKR